MTPLRAKGKLKWRLRGWAIFFAAFLPSSGVTFGASGTSAPPRDYPVGRPSQLDELPEAADLRTALEQLPEAARARGLRWLQSFSFTREDLPALRVDRNGGVFYVCAAQPGEAAAPPPSAAAALPVSPFPTNLIFHSRPGAANILFLNFSGETVSGTDWNTLLGRDPIPATVFSADADLTTFSDAEQVIIKRIWQRVAEDYAPFQIDVTTQRPASFTTRTAHCLITRNTDANGLANPYSTAGGVAYVNVFGTATYASYRPAWVYHNNLSNVESYIAEGAAHEVGHNLGLSHDGRTDGTEYYLGHGTGDTSWAPIMGAGYYRNVTQWSKGEYYLANNTQDDVATLAGKVTYRTDDHGGTAGTATALALSGGTNIVSTTSEIDPSNLNPANKGVLERSTDVDVFSFVTGSGSVKLAVNPLIMPSGMRGGNVDLLLRLYNDAGALLLTNNPAATTTALIQSTLPGGRYYLHVLSTAAGDPFASAPIGYTVYGGVGQYFVSGFVTDPSGFIEPPVAELLASNLNIPGQTAITFRVTYSDNAGINVSTLDGSDIRVTGPNGYAQLAVLRSLDAATDGTPRTATYAVTPPAGGTWSRADNGTYTVFLLTNQVGDVENAWAPPGPLGTFAVEVPRVLYAAYLDTDPGWTLEPEWEYGAPAYTTAGPTAGYTGARIIAYNLDGSYPNRLSVKYATTPAIDCTGVTSVTLRFRRWLRTRSNDPAGIQVSTNGTLWTSIWSSSSAMSDSSWQEVVYALPAGVAGRSAVRLRWSLESNTSQTDIGWNLDDVELLGDGTVDTDPPDAVLSVADLTQGGSPSHACSVTYADETAVSLLALDSADLLVTGPNGYSNLAEFVGADLPEDGSPISGSYSVPAPGGIWDNTDNGTYTVTLMEAAVADIAGNAVARTILGTFEVSILPPPTYALAVTANPANWGTVAPTGGTYTAGAVVEVRAMPQTYFRLRAWTGDAAGSNNPLTVVVDTNRAIQAEFAEILTTNHPTPLWWLAAAGSTNEFESAVTNTGANGMALWESYVAGLDPADPDSRLTLRGRLSDAGDGFVLEWSTVTGRVYTLLAGTNLAEGLFPISAMLDRPWDVSAYTNPVIGSRPAQFHQIRVRKP